MPLNTQVLSKPGVISEKIYPISQNIYFILPIYSLTILCKFQKFLIISRIKLEQLEQNRGRNKDNPTEENRKGEFGLFDSDPGLQLDPIFGRSEFLPDHQLCDVELQELGSY